MALPNIFSRRRRQAQGTGADVYSYDAPSGRLRTQIVQILLEALGPYDNYGQNRSYWNAAVSIMRKEKGVFNLSSQFDTLSEEFTNFLLKEDDTDNFLDGVEVGLRLTVGFHQTHGGDAQPYIDELNARMREAQFGYEFVHPELIRIDNYVLHSQVVVPSLLLLSDARFSSANSEYHRAHEAYRNADYPTAIVEAAKAVESVLKVIGVARGWSIKPDSDGLAKLVAEAFGSGFVPTYMQNQVTSLRSMLDGGVGPVRNKRGAHGAGAQPVPQEPHLAAFQLHQAAAVIVFLVEHDKVTP